MKALKEDKSEVVEILVRCPRVDLNVPDSDGDTPILWALKNDKLAIFDLLAPVSKVNLQGDPSADLTIVCGSEEMKIEFRVHKQFLCYRSSVFRDMLNSDANIIFLDMDSTTVRSMIHYIYTGEMSEDWQDLDILEVASAADTYKLPGWVEVFWTKLRLWGGELTEVQLEEMRIAEETYDTLARISLIYFT